MSNKEATVRSLANCRSVLEKRIERLAAEKEEIVKQRNHLQHQLKKSISVGTAEEQETKLAIALSQVDSLQKENEMVTKEMQDLKSEIEARKLEVRKLNAYFFT